MNSLVAAQTALKYEVEVQEPGRIEIDLPIAAGERVLVIVIPEGEEKLSDLLAASSRSLAFWDNPLDDEDWNDA